MMVLDDPRRTISVGRKSYVDPLMLSPIRAEHDAHGIARSGDDIRALDERARECAGGFLSRQDVRLAPADEVPSIRS